MLAQIERPTNDFHALASYFVHGRVRPTPSDRVAWILTQNLPTDDPMLAADLMGATAARSRRCRNAAYHATINWHPDEQPSPEIMQEIARRTLELAGLAEHQALIMGHGDKPHAHLHMLINRVHPGTGKAWSTAHDYRRFDQIIRRLAEEYGFRHVPPHTFNPELTDDWPKAPGSNAMWAARRGAKTNRPQWSRKSARRFGARLSEKIGMSASWDDVASALAEHGLDLEAKGRGWVVGNATGYAKLSALGLTTSAKGVEKRPARRFRPSPRRTARPASRSRTARRPVWTVDAIDIARALGTRAQLRSAVQEAAARRKSRLARAPVMDQLMAELAEQWKASTSLRPVQRKRPKRPTPPKSGSRPCRSAR